MSIDRGMETDMIHTPNRILLSHKKEWKNVICSHMDEHRNCHPEWNKSDKDKYHIISLVYGM